MDNLEQQSNEKLIEKKISKFDKYGLPILGAGMLVCGIAGGLVGHYYSNGLEGIAETIGALTGIAGGSLYSLIAVQDIKDEIEFEINGTYYER